jgi:hypothetical protein
MPIGTCVALVSALQFRIVLRGLGDKNIRRGGR